MSHAGPSADFFQGIRLIIFDQYKTLTEGGSDPEREIIREFQLKQDYSQVEAVVCGTKWDAVGGEASYLNALVTGLQLPDCAETRQQLEAILQRDQAQESVVKSAPAVLQELRRRGYKLAILSNAATPQYTHVLQHEGLREILDPALCCFSFQLGIVKPDPRIFAHICTAAGVPPSAALMVGDSVRSDFNGSQAAGVAKQILLDPEGKHVDVEHRIHELTQLLDLLPAADENNTLSDSLRVVLAGSRHPDSGETDEGPMYIAWRFCSRG
ncbi:HDHD3 [Symbiodinium microadriaticum]|nr:HDHD3 [Symbiodinium microadriaticum]